MQDRLVRCIIWILVGNHLTWNRERAYYPPEIIIKVHIFRYVTESTFDSYMWVRRKVAILTVVVTPTKPSHSLDDNIPGT